MDDFTDFDPEGGDDGSAGAEPGAASTFSWPWILGGAGAVLALGLGGLFAYRKIKGLPSAPAAPALEGLPGRVVRVASAIVPPPPDRLGQPSPLWDEAMGGKIGPGVWHYYEEGAGTTCGVVAAFIAERAGLPPVLINRDPPGGSGFAVGAHISRLRQGAKSLGWLREPKGGIADLQPGDFYCTVRSGATWQGKPASGEHVGVVLSVGPKDASGIRQVITADGGQTDPEGRQCALRRDRQLQGTRLALVTGPAEVVWWVRPGG